MLLVSSTKSPGSLLHRKLLRKATNPKLRRKGVLESDEIRRDATSVRRERHEADVLSLNQRARYRNIRFTSEHQYSHLCISSSCLCRTADKMGVDAFG